MKYLYTAFYQILVVNIYIETLIFVSLALTQTLVYTARLLIRSQCIARCACLRPSFQW